MPRNKQNKRRRQKSKLLFSYTRSLFQMIYYLNELYFIYIFMMYAVYAVRRLFTGNEIIFVYT